MKRALLQARSIRGHSWAKAGAKTCFTVDVRLRVADHRGPQRDVPDTFTKDRVGEYANMKLTMWVKEAAEVGRLVNKLGQVHSVIEVGRG
ncbi:MAG: hypothetical protein WCA45_15190 [Thiobacillaceae bacterium]